jgi:hypothetical protein
MWNDIEALRTFNWWLGWISIAFILLGGVGVTAAKLLIDRRIGVLERDRDSQLRQQLTDSRRRVAELEEHQRPRTIDPARAEDVVRALKASTFKEITVGTVTDQEAAALAAQVIQIFQKADWKVSSGVFPTVFVRGLLLVVKDISRPAAGTKEVRSAFLSIGVEINIETLQGFGSEAYPTLIVGSKN